MLHHQKKKKDYQSKIGSISREKRVDSERLKDPIYLKEEEVFPGDKSRLHREMRYDPEGEEEKMEISTNKSKKGITRGGHHRIRRKKRRSRSSFSEWISKNINNKWT